MAESKYNFLKYYNKRTDTSSANYKKLGDGETLYHRITLEDFIKTAFIDGPPKSKNPFSPYGFVFGFIPALFKASVKVIFINSSKVTL